MTYAIQWNWFGRNRHGVLFYKGREFLLALPISRKKAEQLIEAGANHGS